MDAQKIKKSDQWLATSPPLTPVEEFRFQERFVAENQRELKSALKDAGFIEVSKDGDTSTWQRRQ
jgi:hypothetical protein